MIAVTQFQELARHLQIVHHIPGRIRFKMNVLQLERGQIDLLRQAASLRDSLGNIPGIKDVRINPLAFTCIVEYDPARIPAQAWSDVLSGAPTAEASVLLDIMARKYQEVVRAES